MGPAGARPAACAGLAHEDSGCQEVAGPSPAEQLTMWDKEVSFVCHAWGTRRREPLLPLSRIWGAFKKGMPFQLNLKDKVFLRKNGDFSNLC